MNSLRDNIFTGFVILILVSVISSCPDDCVCQSDYAGKSLNHYKCSSLNGLVGEERNVSIHSLDLSHANLHRISHTLEKLKDLNNLDLSHNNLSDIGRLGKRIKTLKLNHNKITSGKLTRFPKYVQNLDLSFNDITYLPLEITKLKNLKEIELSGNTINCTCQTLEVRDWMVMSNVLFGDVKCSYPVEIKGQILSDVNKSEICRNGDSSTKDTGIAARENENDLMLGDQPVINEGSGDVDEDELGGTFMLLSQHDNKKLERMVVDDQTDGSGDDETIDRGHTHEKFSVQNEADDDVEEDDGSGSGGGALPIISFSSIDDSFIISTPPFDGYSESEDIETLDGGFSTVTTTTEITPEDVTDEIIVPVIRVHESATLPTTNKPFVEEKVGSMNVQKQDEGDQAEEEEEEELEEEVPNKTDGAVDVQNASIQNAPDNEAAIKEAGANDNSSTYILLGIVLVILLALIIFVAVKRTKANRRNRRQQDPESPRSTELQDMDKKNLGKPIHKNGTAEHAPLIDDLNKTKPVNGNKKVPYVPHEDKDGSAQEPLLKNKEEPDANNYNKIPDTQPESNNNVPTNRQEKPHTKTPVENQEVLKPATRQSLDKPVPEPRKGAYPPPKSPRTKKPSTGDDEVFHPSSPKATSRYSPVYSPETGRVKIKLTETPKPKTPLLVTRSRSNAGDIVTTPTENQQIPDNQ